MQISLAGSWQVALDPKGEFSESQIKNVPTQSAMLPGSLDESGIGEVNLEQGYLGGLSRKVSYVGPAWFTKTVAVPDEIRNQTVELVLERCHWFSDLWVNGVHIGRRESLSVAHHYEFELTESEQVELTIRIDNTPIIPIGRIGHALTDWTQTNWNGIIGEMSIKSIDNGIKLKSVSRTQSDFSIRGKATGEVHIALSGGETLYSKPTDSGEFQIDIPLNKLPEWSDENPSLNHLRLASGTESCSLSLGQRTFVAEGRFFKLNDQFVFLRGTLECCIFPKTGYPPMDTESWTGLFKRVKEFGVNHVRFHSWCPPEGAFLAADAVGVLLQVECPLWTGHWALSSDPELMRFISEEAFRILEAYSHHPSFVLFCLGNEMSFYGEEPPVDELLHSLKAKYPHILFNFSSHGTHLSPACDYYVQADNGKPGAENEPLRGSTWFGVGSRFDREAPSSILNCDKAANQFDRPVIAHEVGEWAVFPDLAEIPKYDGVLEPRNFKKIAEQLKERGMIDQAADFTNASGHLSAKLYKEEIETLMRTSNLAGYQLLGLSDFPGQGTATIGMLNAFWELKGFVSGEEFRRFVSPTVPLLSLPKFVWKRDEVLNGIVRIAHSGPSINEEVTWSLFDENNQCLRYGSFGRFDIKAFNENEIGALEIALTDLPAPARFEVRVAVGQHENVWTIWYFEPEPELPEVTTTKVFHWYRADARQAILNGEKVWLRLNPSKSHMGIAGRFAPAFWSPIHFVEQVGTLGTLIQSEHPAFAEFPTENHSDWHWWEILMKSQSLNLSSFPAEFSPVLQVIDRYERNYKLGSIFEAKIGSASVLVTCIDFETPDRVVARQLERSIRSYLNSSSFSPQQTVELGQLDLLFRHNP
ncbi:hypothetical protein MCEMSE15_02063 [Fimbriimonadaceae bacterium]